jgi:5-methylthioadenosine/S-adenosylhomocysteine deaminase
VNIIRRARFLDSWKKYKAAGVNICLGSDTFPRDMVMQMRTASYMGKVIGEDLKSATAAEVFEAATLNGAKSLGREDIGRLCTGAKADIILIDLTGHGTLRYGPVRDPIKSLVECGIADDIETVIVDGIVRMENRKIPGVDMERMRTAAQQSGEYMWNHWGDWDPLMRTAEQMNPWSFALMN